MTMGRIPKLPPASLSVVIVTHNHSEVLGECLQAATEVLPSDTQFLHIDNASTDGTWKVAGRFSNVITIRSEANVGFSEAMNRGIGATRSDLVLTLGPDVYLQPGFLDALLPALSEPGVAMAGPILLDAQNSSVIDDAGTILTAGWQFKSRGSGEPDVDQYRAGNVLAICGGCCLLRRRAVKDLALSGELFDSDFFAYKEDIDLGWRAHLLGWTCRFEPAARALHGRKGGKEFSPLVRELSIRNRWCLLLKNGDAVTLARQLHSLVGLELYQVINHAPAYGIRRFLSVIPSMLRKRRALRQRRRLTPRQMRQRFRDLRTETPYCITKDPV